MDGCSGLPCRAGVGNQVHYPTSDTQCPHNFNYLYSKTQIPNCSVSFTFYLHLLFCKYSQPVPGMRGRHFWFDKSRDTLWIEEHVTLCWEPFPPGSLLLVRIVTGRMRARLRWGEVWTRDGDGNRARTPILVSSPVFRRRWGGKNQRARLWGRTGCRGEGGETPEHGRLLPWDLLSLLGEEDLNDVTGCGGCG